MSFRNAMAYKVVVAESSFSVQKAIRMAFQEADFEVHFLSDGEEVENALLQINPDAVLLSLSLPNKDGYQIGSSIKKQERFKKTSLILLQGAFESLDKEKLAALEYEILVQEPFDSEKLARSVREILDRKNDPQTLPEELDPGEASFPDVQVELNDQVREFVKQEILEVERELEKRIGTRVLSDVKEWLQKSRQEGKNKQKKKSP